jgi:hypothetical protein
MTPVSLAQLGAGAALTLRGSVFPNSLATASICDNVFSGLSAAVFLYGDLGAITLEGNHVRQATSGFWLLSLRTLAFTEALAPRPDLRLFMDALRFDPAILLGSTLSRGYPFPAGFVTGPGEEIKVDAAPFTPPPPPTNVSLLAVRRGFALSSLLLALERTAFTSSKKKFPFSGIGSENEIFAVNNVGNTTGSLTGLLVWSEPQDTSSAFVLSANQIRHVAAGPRLPTAAIALVNHCSVTGNLVLNESPESIKTSLLVAPAVAGAAPAVAVTGNVLRGQPILPARPLPAPFNTWDVFNTILPI